MLKVVLLTLCMVALANCSQLLFTEKELEQLKNADPEILPPFLKPKAGDNSHWCCSNDKPPATIQRTKVATMLMTVSTKVNVGYVSCGFMNLMSCSVYEMRTKQQSVTYIQTYEVPDLQSCDDHHVKCCKDYIEVAGNCMALTTVSEHYDMLIQLLQAGLLSPAAVGK